MHKRLSLVVALASVIVLSAAAVAFAGGEKPIVVRAGNLVLTLNGGVSPKALPSTKLAPIALHFSATIATADGSHPPALKELNVDTGPSGAIDTSGIPVCNKSKLEATNTAAAEKACPGAIVGTGSTEVSVEFPESTPFSAKGPLVVFNGGTKGGKTLIYIHAYVAVPAPTAIVETVTISKEHKGPYNLHAEGPVPLIAGGSGSITSFELTINRRGYLLASCVGGRFFAHVTAAFRNGTDVAGTVTRTCRAIG